jgi:hypothetical protein
VGVRLRTLQPLTRSLLERTLSGRLKPSVLVELELPEARALANSSFCLESSALRLKNVLEDTEVDLDEAGILSLRQRLS